MKKNDFLLASINNPEFSPLDFKDIAGYSLKDTLMLKEEDYLNSNYIKSNPLFLDSSGVFSESKFKLFYNKTLLNFADFTLEDFANRYEYSVFDTRRKAGDKVKPFGMTFFLSPNPELRSVGVIGPNKPGPKTLSDREIAQREKIFDPETGEFSDKSPNDFALGNDIFGWLKEATIGEPLVLATYDENGEHYDNILGKQVKHKKGQLKLNTNGRPYYERLNGRSLIGKDVLAATDILTVDGSAINKYDFLDSDGLDKSVTGTIMKTAAAIAPLFTPAGPYYGAALAAREIAKALPMLYGIGTVLFTDLNDSYLTNLIAGYMLKLTTSLSDYSKLNMFSVENFGSLIADIALQWEQQQAIIKGFNKLTKANEAARSNAQIKALDTYKLEASKLLALGKNGTLPMARVQELIGASNKTQLDKLVTEGGWKFTKVGLSASEKFGKEAEELIAKRTRFGQNLSLAYMAIISNTDVYQDALNRGASKEEAAALALGSTAGMFVVDKWAGLGEAFFQVPAERQLYRTSVRQSAKEITENLPTKIIKEDTKKGLGLYFMEGLKVGKDAINKYHTQLKDRSLSLIGKSLGEGLEEVSEELVTDVVKSMGELAAKYGWIEGPKDLGAWDSMGERYAMSLFGGALGGAIFGLKEGSFSSKQAMLPLHLLVRQGKAGEIRKELKNLYEKGQLGDTDLSIDTETIKDDKGNPIIEDGKTKQVYLTADNKHISLNEFVYNTLLLTVDQLETIMLKDRLNASESDLFERLVLSDERFLNLQDWLQDKSYITGYYQRYLDLVNSIVETEGKIASLSDSQKKEREELEKSRNEKLLERDKFLKGELSFQYMQDLILALNPSISSGFLSLNKELFTRNYFKKTIGKDVKYQELTGDAKTLIDQLYDEYLLSPYRPKNDLVQAGKAFRQLNAQMSEVFKTLIPERFHTEYADWENVISLQKEVFEDQWDVDTQLEGESDEDYEYRMKPKEGESLEDFANRLNQRQGIIDLHNREWMNWIHSMALKGEYYMDENTKRALLVKLGATKEQRKKILTKNATNPKAAEIALNTEDPNQIMEVLKNSLRDLIREQIEQEIDSQTIGKLTPEQTAMFGGITEYSFVENLPQVLDNVKFALGLTNIESVYDLYNALKTKGENPIEVLKKLYMEAGIEIDESLLIDPNNPIPNDLLTKALEKFIKQVEKLPDTLTPVEKEAKLKEIAKNIPIVDYSASAEDALIELRLQEELSKNSLELEASKLMQTLTEDLVLKDISDIEKATVTKGPARMLLKYLASKMGDESVQVDKALDTIFLIWLDLDNPGEFELSETQKNYLQLVSELIEIAKSIVAAASKDTWIGDGITYNKAINQFVEKHPDIMEGKWNPLYEMDKNIGESLIYSLDSFLNEIDQWLALSAKNFDNKPEAIKKAKQAYDEARKVIFKSQLSSFRLTSDFDKENEELFYFEKEFHDRIQKALAQGESIEGILKEIRNSLGNDDELMQLRNTDIDEMMTILTPYDQYMYLAAIAATDPMKVRENIAKFIDGAEGKLAPLITLFPGILYMQAFKDNPEIMKAAIKSIEEIAAKKGLKMPTLNGVILTGLGGGGKSEYWARYAMEQYAPERTWVSGPKQSQVDNLTKLNPKVTGKTKEELILYITGGDLSVLDLFEVGNGIDGNVSQVLKNVLDKLVKADIDALVIDEGSHYSNLELLLIGQWADLIGAQLTVLADENQNGNVTKVGSGNIINLNREFLIGLRAPRINLSLRTDNIWTTTNQKNVVRMLNTVRSSSEATKSEVSKQVDDFMKDFKLSYYENDQILNGDKVIEALTPDDIARLKKGKTIAFIGDSNSETYKLLKSQIPNIEAFSLEDVQGREFDYIVSLVPIEKYNTNGSLIDKFTYLLKLYTIISRGRKGSLVITSNLQSKLEKYTTDSIGLNSQVKEQIIKDFKDELETLKEKYTKKESEKEPNTEEEESEKESEEESEDEESEEPIPGFDAPPINKDDTKELQQLIETESKGDIELASEVKNGPRQGFGDVSFLGVQFTEETRTIKKGYVSKRYIWVSNGKRKNVGIFATEKGQEIARDDDKKTELAHAVSNLQASLLFGKDLTKLANWNTLPESIRKVLKRELMGGIKYYVVAEDYDEGAHSFLRKNRIYKRDKTSFILGEDGKDKVISVEARIPVGNEEYVTITLGAVRNPDRWLEAINARTEPSKGKKKWREAQDLEKAHVKEYRKELQEIVKELEREIEKPKFNLQTELYDVEGEPFRLEDMYFEPSKWIVNTRDFVKSPVHIITGDLKGLNKKLSDKLKGHPVIYVTADPSLAPEDLSRIWQEQQLNREGTTPVVRMIVLNNMGVSFGSLYREAFADKYRRSDAKTDVYLMPFRKEPMAIRMFASFWNFRANLLNFDKAIDEWLKEIGKNKDWLLEVAKLDRDYYILASGSPTEDDAILSDSQFNKWLDEHPELERVDDVKSLRAFNDSLHDKVRLFRVGYSENGAYIRTLKLKEGNEFYPDINNAYGTYINPELIPQYLGVLNGFFTLIIDKIFTDTTGLKPEQNIKYNKDKKWYLKLKKSRKCTLTLGDGTAIKIPVPEQSALISLPFAIVDAAKYLHIKSLIGKDKFDIAYELKPKEGENPKYRINLEFNEGTVEVDYRAIDEAFEFNGEKGIFATADEKIEGLLGHRKFVKKHEDGSFEEMWIDTRMDTFYNLLFHGIVDEGKYNMFDKDHQLHDSLAIFNKGFFSDPTIVMKFSKEDSIDAESSTNNALFASDNIPGMPYFIWSAAPKTIKKGPEGVERLKVEEESEITKLLKAVKAVDPTLGGTKVLPGKEKAAMTNLLRAIQDKKKRLIQAINIPENPIYLDFSKMIYNILDGNIITFKDFLEQYIKDNYSDISPNILGEFTEVHRDEALNLIYNNDDYRMILSYDTGAIKVKIEGNRGLGTVQAYNRLSMWQALDNKMKTVPIEELDEVYDLLREILDEILAGESDWVIFESLLDTTPRNSVRAAKLDINSLEDIISEKTGNSDVGSLMSLLLNDYKKEINCLG